MKVQKIDVQFRKFRGEIIAVFPYEIDSIDGDAVCSYMHIGQHSACAWHINNFSKPAKVEEYQSLKNELESIGYELNIVKRRNHDKFLKAIKLNKNRYRNF